MLTAIVGINWGDEGKGRMVDLLGANYDMVVRYQGGNNAGHTVVNDKGTFILNLLPSGILRDNTVNVMGNGMVIDLQHLCGEICALRDKGIPITPDRLKISDKAIICLPYHKQQDILEEDRLGTKKQGSTLRGIAPAYADKYMRKGIRMGDLRYPQTLAEKLDTVLPWKNLTLVCGYGAAPLTAADTMAWLREFGDPLLPYICDTGDYLARAIEDRKDILFEAQLGALRDIEFGIYPYTSSSQTLASYATTGAGVPGAHLSNVMGIMKAYSSSVGGGPFAAELFGPEADALRAAGSEYGAATGRPRRVGYFDVPASRYGTRVQGADSLVLTKLDVLSYLDRIPVCVAYEVDGQRVTDFPTDDRLAAAKPVYEYLPGFRTDISGCRFKSDLPREALDYIRYLEKAVGCAIRYVSVGAGRDAYVAMLGDEYIDKSR
ncbi:MAG: adenylosuccinate synthase [Oscillospiraceae bacterium]|jgi:adenylosuccinate synthase|nr:adenylosuccinate synthase [Oscillospiraceae bacterium]